MDTDWFRLAQRIRVSTGFVFLLLFLFFSRPRRELAVAGFLIALMGLALRLWAAGCIEKSRELEVRGPYRHTRNPLYLGSFLIGAGSCIAAANLWLIAAFALLFLGIYGPVMKREEEEMRQLFPDKFPDYQRAVPLLVPRLTTRLPGSSLWDDGAPLSALCVRHRATRGGARFRWARLRRNREYNAVLGFVALFAWICFRLWKS